MLPAFLFATFSAATLLFVVQPIVARQLLPVLGGSPAVWNTCMVFFQVALVLGYAYAHILTRVFRKPAIQISVHAIVLIGALLVLPIGVPADLVPDKVMSPTSWILYSLVQSVGAPFFALASASPLLQRWFSRTDHRWAADPYFLYAASNAGSMLALLGYPLLVEPNLTISSQLVAWSFCFAGFGGLALLCGVLASKRCAPVTPTASAAPTPVANDDHKPAPRSPRSRLRWLLFAFVPSSLMLGVTQHISTDVAPTPMLWVLPLAIYLLTHIIAFTSWGRPMIRVAQALLPTAVLAVAVLAMLQLRSAIVLRIAIHLGVLLVVGLTCHGRLVKERPDTDHLTEFYLLLAIGGALGGVFNALAAPLLFDWVAEYPLILVIACLLRNPKPSSRAPGKSVPVPSLSDCVGIGFFVWFYIGNWATLSSKMDPLPFLMAAICLLTASHPRRFTIGVVTMLAYPQVVDVDPHLYRGRTFFGTYEVTEESDGSGHWHHLYHGTTLHGSQYSQQPWASQPTVYYTLDGPVGDLLTALKQRPGPYDLACVGLGCGTLATIGERDWKMTFFEIDPQVQAIAADPGLFKHIHDSQADVQIVIGDARLEMARCEDQFDMIFLDAFSSDAIPTHLMTKEAIQVYLERLKPGGILAFHVTNRYLDLPLVLTRIADDLGLVAAAREDSDISDTERIERRKLPTHYVAIARAPADLSKLTADLRWRDLVPDEHTQAWTDDYSNLLQILKR